MNTEALDQNLPSKSFALFKYMYHQTWSQIKEVRWLDFKNKIPTNLFHLSVSAFVIIFQMKGEIHKTSLAKFLSFL